MAKDEEGRSTMKYKCIVEYEYPTEHKPPVSAEIYLHGDKVKTTDIKFYPKGKWTQEEAIGWYRCTACNEINLGNPLYCPDCGAKME